MHIGEELKVSIRFGHSLIVPSYRSFFAAAVFALAAAILIFAHVYPRQLYRSV